MSQPNINVEELQKVLFEIDAYLATVSALHFPELKKNIDNLPNLIKAAFPLQPKEEWRPKLGDKVWFIELNEEKTFEIHFNSGWEKSFEMGLIKPNFELANEFIAKYKEWLKTI